MNAARARSSDSCSIKLSSVEVTAPPSSESNFDLPVYRLNCFERTLQSAAAARRSEGVGDCMKLA
jgi:hypothetical protein